MKWDTRLLRAVASLQLHQADKQCLLRDDPSPASLPTVVPGAYYCSYCCSRSLLLFKCCSKTLVLFWC